MKEIIPIVQVAEQAASTRVNMRMASVKLAKSLHAIHLTGVLKEEDVEQVAGACEELSASCDELKSQCATIKGLIEQLGTTQDQTTDATELRR